MNFEHPSGTGAPMAAMKAARPGLAKHSQPAMKAACPGLVKHSNTTRSTSSSR